MTHHIVFVNSVWENYKSGIDFVPTYENSTKKFFKATVPKPIRQGLQVHDLTAEESVSTEKKNACSYSDPRISEKASQRN